MFENLSERISGISKGVLPGTEGEKKQKKRKQYEISLKWKANSI